jgi:hypothetical protein
VADDLDRTRRLLTEASDLMGEGRVLVQIWTSPVIEWVYVGAEDDSVVVSDNGEAFGWIAGLHGRTESYLPWSTEMATTAASRFGVDVLDEGGEGYQAFRLTRRLRQGESLAEVVQSVALAIDGTLALHTPLGSPSYDAYFWDRDPE